MKRLYGLLSVFSAAFAVLVLYYFGPVGSIPSFIGAVFAVAIGIYGGLFASKMESSRQDMSEFEVALEVLDQELEANLSIPKKHRVAVLSGDFSYGALSLSAVDLVIKKPTVIRYGGKLLHKALFFCGSRIRSYLALYGRFEAHAYANKGLNSIGTQTLVQNAEQTEFTIALLRSLLRKFKDNRKSLLSEETYSNYEKALEYEKELVAENPATAYETLKNEVVL